MYVNHASVQPTVSIGWLANGGRGNSHAAAIFEPIPQSNMESPF